MMIKNLIRLYALFLFLSFASCGDKDPCEDVACFNGFSCESGQCVCEGFLTNEGATCNELDPSISLFQSKTGYEECYVNSLDKIVALKRRVDLETEETIAFEAIFENNNDFFYFDKVNGEDYNGIAVQDIDFNLRYSCSSITPENEILAPTRKIIIDDANTVLKIEYHTFSGLDLEESTTYSFSNN